MDVTEWLLDSDPALRWQVLRDVVGADEAEIARERSRVVGEGWGADLLGRQDPDGRWDGGTYRPGWVDEDLPFFDAWTATHFSLVLLRELGVGPAAPQVRTAIEKVRDNVMWWDDLRYFDGETEPCINGLALANAAYFGEGGEAILATLLRGQLEDGGWNCDAEDGATVSSFHTTICVLEGLLAWEQAGMASEEVTAARKRGEEYLLERNLFRSRSTGAVVDLRFTLASFPTYWYYDYLRGLDYLRTAGRPDPRCTEAIELLRSRQDSEGRWRQENSHQGPRLVRVDVGDGRPSRWNTLRALRVLAWWGSS
jgi:hypothetical protein